MPRRSASGFAGISVTDLWKRKGEAIGARWWVRTTYPGGRRESTTYADEPGLTRRGVAERANQERARVQDGRQTVTAGDLRHLGADYVRVLRARGKSETYARHIERVVDALVRRGITDVKGPTFRADVEEWLAGLKANWWAPRSFKFKRKEALALTGSLKNRILRELRSVLNNAVASHVIAYSPLDGIKPFATVEKARDIPTVAEVATLVADQPAPLSDTCAVDPWWLPFCLLTYTGCRVEEAMHLEWRDIDLKARLVHVRHKPGVYLLKKKRERSLPLQPELLAILKPLFKTTGFLIEDARLRSNGSDWHLREDREPAKRTKPTHPDYSPAFRRYLMRRGMKADRAEALSPHSLRHFYISAMLASGAQWDDVMQWAGHSQASTTLRYRAMKQLIARDVADWPAGQFQLRAAVAEAKAPMAKAAAD